MSISPNDLFQRYDPSADLFTKTNETVNVRIHVHQRNAKMYQTTIENLEYHITNGDDPKDVLKNFLVMCRNTLMCGGCILMNKDGCEVIQLQGNHRVQLIAILQEKYDVSKTSITCTGGK
jgi:translation initiation factor 1 (eIF-1/SUI1)